MLDIIIVLLSIFIFYRLYTILGIHSSDVKENFSSISKPVSASLLPQEAIKKISISNLALPKNFDEMHFMQGAFNAYKMMIRYFFEKNMFPCSSFLSLSVKSAFEANFQENLSLNRQDITYFSLKSVSVTAKGIEAFVICNNELIVHNTEKNSFETIILNHCIGFLNPVKTSEWICISVEQN